MKLRNFFKSMLVGSVTLPLKAASNAKIVEFQPTEIKSLSVDAFKEPQRISIEQEDGIFTMMVAVTDQILIGMPDGTFEYNTYRSYVKLIADCKLIKPIVADSLWHKFESQMMDDGTVTQSQVDSFIAQCKKEFEDILREGKAANIQQFPRKTTISV